MDTALGPDVLWFKSLTGLERLGQPFYYRLEVLSNLEGLTGFELIGQAVAIHFEGAGGVRHFHAFVEDLEVGTSVTNYARYHLTLRPWIWLLSQVTTCRIFQGQTIPDIVKSVFRERGYTDFDDLLFGQYTARETVVQYCESDLNFVNRLLEEEGIYYFFRHVAGRHVLTLADSQSSHSSAPECASLPYYPPDSHRQRLGDFVDTWAPAQRFRPDAFATKAYDFKRPTSYLVAEQKMNVFPAVAGFEVFEYPGAHLSLGVGESYARVRLEELHSRTRTVSASTNAAYLLATPAAAL